MGLFGALAGVASRFLPAVGTIARGAFGIGRKILSTLGILKEKAQPIIQTVQKGWEVARDAANLIPNPETRGKVQGWMDNVGRQAGNYYNKANDYYNQAGHYMDQGERFFNRGYNHAQQWVNNNQPQPSQTWGM
ncbi:hypothetical protein TVAGG3_1021060 [Trichomonas vaginalis G3]|uniref:hypothetical protein n=1 Tax=Trichomonas vaginalis (strain ATCC PRA-98 / G3) TaxID=412133 RepID=UPI0021E5C701|nr:hypothetical protein TVAGG3_1021060 [Trichomonas vaginalis G3]KAI5492139.1 hypothetical protein TVAGG3_1021060 [Trichomonas vaginalis G3]